MSNAGAGTRSVTLPDPEKEPTILIPRAAAILKISLRAGYAAAERGELPTIKVGRSIRVPTARFLRKYGFLDEQPSQVA